MLTALQNTSHAALVDFTRLYSYTVGIMFLRALSVYSFLIEKVKAQGRGQTPDVVTHPVSTKFTPGTWIVCQQWHVTGKENGSIPGNPSVLCLPLVQNFLFSSRCRVINYINYTLAVCKTYHLVLRLWQHKIYIYILLPSPGLESGWVDKTCF